MPKIAERRRRPDRRRFSWRTLWFALWGGRRRRPRRRDERHRPHYVDIYDDHRLLVWTVGVVTFCVLDAFLTLQILDRGGIELNPFMAFLLGLGTATFVYVKYLVTALAVIVILFHVNHRLFGLPVRHLLPAFFFFYAALIGYEAFLLSA